MGSANNIGKYQIGRTIGEGMFAKVKLAVDSTNGNYVAVKIIDKRMVMKSNLMFQACSTLSFSTTSRNTIKLSNIIMYMNYEFCFFLIHHVLYQVQREIRTMKILRHPNIVRIHEVCKQLKFAYSLLFSSLCSLAQRFP